MANTEDFIKKAQDSIMEQTLKDLLGANPAPATIQGVGSEKSLQLPEGIASLDRLPPYVARDYLDKNIGNIDTGVWRDLNARLTKRELAEQKESEEDINLRNIMGLVGFNSDKTDEQIDDKIGLAYGPENLIFGNDPNETNMAQAVASTLRGALSSDFRDSRQAKASLKGTNFLKAYKSLAGSGQISNFESQQAESAYNTFLSSEGNDAEAAKQMRILENVLSASEFRRANKIFVDNLGNGQQYQSMPDGTLRSVFVTVDDQGQFTIKDNPTNEAIYAISPAIEQGSQQFKNIYDGIQPGALFSYQGRVHRKGQKATQ